MRRTGCRGLGWRASDSFTALVRLLILMVQLLLSMILAWMSAILAEDLRLLQVDERTYLALVHEARTIPGRSVAITSIDLLIFGLTAG